MNNESARELNAYRAHELARAGMNIGTILDKVVGHYDQGVVDAAASARHKVETVKKKVIGEIWEVKQFLNIIEFFNNFLFDWFRLF